MSKHHSLGNQNNIMIAGIALGAIIIAILLAVLVKSTAEEHECNKKMWFYDTSTRKCRINTPTGQPIEANTNKITFTTSNREITVTGSLAANFNGTKVLFVPALSEISGIIEGAEDSLQKPFSNANDRKRYAFEAGQISFALDTPKSWTSITVYRGKGNLLYATSTNSGAIVPGAYVAIRGQLTAPEYIARVILAKLDETSRLTCRIYEAKTSSAGTIYYTLQGAGCAKLDSMYQNVVFSVNDNRIPSLITMVPTSNTTLDIESIMIPSPRFVQ